MAARFTEHGGDPAWLKSQREAEQRAVKHGRVHRAMPYPTATTPVRETSASNAQFVAGAKDNSGVAFVLGAVAAAYLMRRKR